MPELKELEKRIKALEKEVEKLKKADEKIVEKTEKMVVGSKEHILKTIGMGGSSGGGFSQDKINKIIGK